MSIFTNWGSNPRDRKMEFGCDKAIKNINGQYFRAVNINAPTSLVFDWLCQIRVAPYSYDKLDNGGKQSPQYLPQNIKPLEKNQKMMTIFNVESFIPNQEITLVMDVPPGKWAIWYVPTAITYKLIDIGQNRTRLVAKYVACWSTNSLFGQFERLFVVFADFIMMRRQLLNIKKLAERDFGARSQMNIRFS